MSRTFRREVRAALATRDAAAMAPFDLARLISENRTANEYEIRQRCQGGHFGGNDLLCRVLGRYLMFCDTQDYGVSPHLMLNGFWEMWLTEALAAVVKPGMTVVDAGANVGYFTLLMADLVGERGRVHAFECQPRTAALLRRSVELNGFRDRAQVHEVALSDAAGQVELVTPNNDPKNARIDAPPGWFADAPRITVPSNRMDAVLDRADVVKIDVEGAEQNVWRGMAGLLAHGRTMSVFVEFAADRYAAPRTFLEELTAPGFDLALLDYASGIRPTSYDEILLAPPTEDLMLVLRR